LAKKFFIKIIPKNKLDYFTRSIAKAVEREKLSYEFPRKAWELAKIKPFT